MVAALSVGEALFQEIPIEIEDDRRLFFALLRTALMGDRNVTDARRLEEWVDVAPQNQALPVVGCLRFQTAVVNRIRYEPADILMHPPGRFQKDAPL